MVIRNLSSSTAKDVRRYRLFEKALDALATSPYARSVYQWVLAGRVPVNTQTKFACAQVRLPFCYYFSWLKFYPWLNHGAQICKLAGLGNGGRVAAVVASRCRGTIAGVALLSYPLLVRRHAFTFILEYITTASQNFGCSAR